MKFLMFLFVISCFFLSPMAMSHGLLFIGVIVNLAISMLYYGYCRCSGFLTVKLSAHLYLLFLMVFLTTVIFTNGINDIISTSSYMLSILLVFQFSNSYTYFFRYFNNVVFLLCFLAILGEVLYCFIPQKELLLTTLDFSRNNYKYTIYMPLDLLSPYWINNSSSLNRHYMFFGEPGIAPAFIFPAFCAEIQKHKSYVRNFRIIVFLAAMVLTLSTTFPVALFGGLYFYYFFSHKITIKSLIIAFLLGMVCLVVFLYVPYFGYYAKLESSIYSVNVDARFGMAEKLVKQVELLVTIIVIYSVSKYKFNAALYKAVNCEIAICAMANIMFLTNLHLIYLFFFDSFTENEFGEKFSLIHKDNYEY